MVAGALDWRTGITGFSGFLLAQVVLSAKLSVIGLEARGLEEFIKVGEEIEEEGEAVMAAGAIVQATVVKRASVNQRRCNEAWGIWSCFAQSRDV